MPSESSSRVSGAASALLALVALIILFPLGAIITTVVAQTMGGNQPARILVSADPVSDSVSATAAEFRVDESGAATYSIPLFVVPGTAGVAPQLTLSYSSQGGDGPVGKGWAIGGLSSIARCRATREAGDFIASPTLDGNPRPINFSSTDRFCLDGQRLIPSTAACPGASGMTGVALATEVDSFFRVCAYSSASSTSGPAFFTVDRKDGSTSWYGDRDNNNSSNRPDGYFETNSQLNPTAALTWAQTRFQDSTGNYVDYIYQENPAGARTGEQLISEVRYTGKTVLPGQTGSASAPFAKVVFNYAVRSAEKWSKGYASGGTLTQSRLLSSITSCASMACGTTEQARQYLLTYTPAASGANVDTLIGVQECRDNTAAVCASPTSFIWTQGRYEFASQEVPANLPITISSLVGFKSGDINGDGRSDFVYMRGFSPGCHHSVVSMVSVLDNAGSPTYSGAGSTCLNDINFWTRGDGAWHLLDYNGDGRDDLFISGPDGQGWKLYASNGTGFDTSQNLIAGLTSIIPSYPGKNDQVQLADVNGDGLTDVIYPSNGALRVRSMERLGNSFGWNVERTIAIDEASMGSIGPGCDGTDPGVTCTRTLSGVPTPKTSFMQMADFNGDAASDLIIQVNTSIRRYNYGAPGCDDIPRAGPPVEWSIPPYEPGTGEETDSAKSVPGDSCQENTNTVSLQAFVVKQQDSATVGVSNYGTIASANPFNLTFADSNGDGLTDVFYRATTNSEWVHQINKGTGFISGGSLPQTEFREQTRFQDVNGDGRSDALVLTNYGSYKAFAVRYAIGTGGYAAPTAMQGGGARLCTGSCNQDEYLPIFSDLDMDGNLDFMSMKLENSPALYVSRSASKFSPRDAIIKVVNGFGAETDLTYAPLTNKDIYRRDSGSRNSPPVGRGSPVSDVLAPSYVIAKVSSSSPRITDQTAKATLHYRYAGAKLQAGGRGFLGFREVITFDPNQSGGYVATTTQYSQNFPLVGVPSSTVKTAFIGATYAVPPCIANGMSEGCYPTLGQTFPSLGGSVFSNKAQVWDSSPNSLANQVPLHVRTIGSEEILRDPYTGAQTSKVATAFTYIGKGNVSVVSIQSFNGSDTAAAATMLTSNTYVDDLAKWRLGRLTASTVTHKRPGQADVVKTTGFSYEMSGPASGLMTEEKTQPGGAAEQALTKAYTLDQYGNRTQSTTCAAPAACGSASFNFHPTAANNVMRYSRVEYDARGRFPVSTIEPFWTEAGGEERTTSRVLERNIFGDVTNSIDVNSVRSMQVRGILGREYFAWVQSSPNASPGNGGLTSKISYRWCGGGISCPNGAKARQQAASQGNARKWTYLDALGRAMMTASETLNAGVVDKDVAASCTEFDVSGKARRTSNPFFVAGVAGESGPTGVENACATPERLWTTTTFDVLGRPTLVVAPDGSQVSNSYNGLTTIATDARGNPTTQTRNSKGELTTVVDAASLSTSYIYNADGNLKSVSRDAGAGVVVNSFSYDTMGRKTQQVDPDSGTTNFAYNALGEMVAQVDSAGQRTEFELDARGRVWRKTVKQTSGAIETQSTSVYDIAENGSGLVSSETIAGAYTGLAGQAGTDLSYKREHYYDELGRSVSQITTIDDAAYGAATEYDALGRPWRTQDASGLWIKAQYNSRGVVALCDTSTGDYDPVCQDPANTYKRILSTDAWGNVLKERRGGTAAMDVARTYHAQTGRISSICSGNTACNLTNEVYGWDGAGNLTSHQKESRYLEAFQYDSLNRVIEAKVLTQNGAAVNVITLAQGYDKLGNVCMKNGMGFDYAGADGCAGAAAMSSTASSTSSYGASSSTYQIPQQSEWKLPTAWRESRARQAPETPTRRYSNRDDRPSWDRDADNWGRDELELSNSPTFVRSSSVRMPTVQASTRQPVISRAPVGQGSIGIMSVGTGSPHAVSQAGSGTGASFYYYDSHGNQTSRDAPGTAGDRTIKYSVDDKAYEIAMGSGQRVRFWYGPDGQRYKREEAGKTTLYLNGVEVVIVGGVVTVKRYVAGVALQTVSSGVVGATKYMFTNHLGSLVRIANADGSVADSLDFAPFGARRSYSNPAASAGGVTATDRSFTGHEAVDGTGVIHMNGRIYDSEVGRFLQADPVIQAPDNTQSWNAYTYCFNNPLAYTDPSGNITFRQILGIAIAIIGTYLTMGMDGGYFANIGWAIAFGAVSGYVATGTLKGALTGAFTAGITFGVGQLGLDIWVEVAFQSMTGGIVEGINGGNFGNGFLAAGLTTAVMPHIGGGSRMQNIVTGALVGGAISKATGGKFANGAMTGAIQGAMRSKAKQQQPADGLAPSEVSEPTGMPLERDEALNIRNQGVKIFQQMRADGVMDGMQNYDKIGEVRSMHENAFQVKYDGDRIITSGGGEIYADADVLGYTGINFHRIDSLDGFMSDLFHEVAHLDPALAAQWRKTLPGIEGRIESEPDTLRQQEIHKQIAPGVRKLIEIYNDRYRP